MNAYKALESFYKFVESTEHLEFYIHHLGPLDFRNKFLKLKNKNLLIRIFEILDYDGRSRYTDIVLLTLLIEINYMYIYKIYFLN